MVPIVPIGGLSDELISERLEDGIMPGGNEGSHEQRCTHACPATADEALAAPFAGLPGERSKPCERSDLAAVEAAEFGQFGNQGTCNAFADAGNGGQQILLETPGWRGADLAVEIGIEALELAPESGE